MMSALTRKQDEVKRLLETYMLYKDCNDEYMRRKVHLDLDRFLMENRDTAIICMERVLADEIQELVKAQKQPKPGRLGLLGRFRLWRTT